MDEDFEAFFAEVEPRLRAALSSKHGGQLGREAAAEALAYGWRNWERIHALDNAAGYLYRVGDRWARRQARRITATPWTERAETVAATSPSTSIEPGLAGALEALTLRQRQVITLTVGFGLTHAETADLLGVSKSTVQNHAERGLSRLRRELGVSP